MRDRKMQRANRKYYRSKEREEARCAGMDNIIGNRRVYRDPTAHEAMKELCRPTQKADPVERVQNTVYTGPDSIPLMTRVLLPDGTVTNYPVRS